MKSIKILIISILILAAASMALTADTYTSNLTLTLPERGSANWDTKINSNFTDLDSAYGGLEDVASEVYVYNDTFNGTTRIS